MTGRICSFSRKGVRSWDRFAGDVAATRPLLRTSSGICNALADRYSFMVGLAAAMLEGKTTILPSGTAIEAVAGTLLAQDQPLILGGLDIHARLARRIEALPSGPDCGDGEALRHHLSQSRAPVHVFTSGTTKAPRLHVKNWRILYGGAVLTRALLETCGLEPASTGLLGTTPHQHMYGLEATVFASLGWSYPTFAANIFFPADLEGAIADAQNCGLEHLALITSPAHLRFLEPTILASPEIAAVISATAPLSQAQAQRLEARGDLPVMEIYGSTETGSLAVRRTIEGPAWQPLAGFGLEQTEAGGTLASAPHLPEAVALGDDIHIGPDGRFRLLGRLGDMVSMSGKRTSLSALNAILAEADGLRDGIVLHKKHDPQDELAVIAVADPEKNMSEAEIRQTIRARFHDHLDPVFAPKRIAFTDKLPRSGTGKIPADQLEALWRFFQ